MRTSRSPRGGSFLLCSLVALLALPACTTDASGTGAFALDDSGLDAAFDGSGSDSSGGDDTAPGCGNGVVEGVEECDDGNAVNGDGCDTTCTLTCIAGNPNRGDTACDDGNACDGPEACTATHTCSKGTPLGDGTSCGTGKICRAAECADVVCGDGIVTAPEECDDGNSTAGDGCEPSTCLFSCVSSDASRNCAAKDACAGNGTCDDGKHVCAPGTPAKDGTACGSGGSCKGGVCVPGSCGDGVVQTGESCDFGATNGPGSGCEVDCTFSCATTPSDSCAADPCGGSKCTAVTVGGSTGQKCVAGVPLGDGTSCGTNKVCKGGVCTPSTCGDGLVESGEDCDFGASNGAGTGCELTCKYSCAKAPSDTCNDGNACNGVESCGDVTVGAGKGQKCSTGTPLADGTSCGGGGSGPLVCEGGKCVTPPPTTCGDGNLDTGEQCDFGTGNGAGTGCEANCTFSCSRSPTDSCVDGNACNGVESCQTITVGGKTGQKCAAGTNVASCTSCPGGVCLAGVCRSPTCGDACLETGEQCDFGGGNGAGTGCEATCKFSCTKAPDSCVLANACSGQTCQSVSLGGAAGQKCGAGTPPPTCSACGTGGVCVSTTCKSPSCGDGCVTAPEQCEPPGTATCSAACQTIVVASCGNGVREGSEQCDDGNKTNLDGCDGSCKFEQEQRANSITMVYDRSICTNNALGAGVKGAQSQLDPALTNGVKDGSTTIGFDFLGLADLSGTTGSFNLGILGGTPVAYTGTTTGASDLDWWYTADPASIGTNRLPTAVLAATFSAKKLSASGSMILSLNLGGGATPLRISSAQVAALVGGASLPTESASGNPPGHLAGEHLNPALTSFGSMSNGTLCGNIAASSLSKVAVPATILQGGSFPCGEGYTASNTMLDVLVGGCHVFGGFVTVIAPTQPDQVDASQPNPGGKSPYTLSAATKSHAIDTCTDSKKATFPIAVCEAYLAYSSSFKFTTDRVIFK